MVDPRAFVRSALASPDATYQLLPSILRQSQDKDVLRAHEWAVVLLWLDRVIRQERINDVQRLFDMRPRRLVPLMPVTLLESALSEGPNLITYGSGRVFGDGLVFGQLHEFSYAYQMPTAVQEIGAITDGITKTAVALGPADVSFENQILRFNTNPFNLVTPTPVYDSTGQQVDRQIKLWLHNVWIDDGLLNQQFGEIIGLTGPASETLLDQIQAMADRFAKQPGPPIATT